MTISQSLKNGFKNKAFHFYGRISRKEFWSFYIASYFVLIFASALYFVPIVGQLLYAIVFMLVLICQLSATVRRLHDLNNSAKLVALPYLLILAFFIARLPLYALASEYAPMVLNLLVTAIVLSFIYIFYLCTKEGSKGDNLYGTDPLDPSGESKDFINPKHMQAPELKGDPWRNYKKKQNEQNNSSEQNQSEANSQLNSANQAEQSNTTSKIKPENQNGAESFQDVLIKQHQDQVDRIKQKALQEGLEISDEDIMDFIKSKQQDQNKKD